MAISVTSAPWQQVNMPALDLRRYLWAVGLQEGIRAVGDMAVAQRAAGANMTVDVATGFALVQGDAVTNQGLYLAYNDATTNVGTFSAAHATLPRIDRVTIRLRDAFHGDAANDVSFQIVTGTATSGATLVNLNGAAAVPSSQLLLANVLIPATATTVTTANIANVVSVSGQASAPVGTVIDYITATAPNGYLAMDGSAVSRTGYAGLFNLIGTTYGTGDGSTTFNLPNAKGRVTVMLNAADAEFDAIGETGGAKTHTLTTAELAVHNHTLTDPGHFHTVVAVTAVDTADNTAWYTPSQGGTTAPVTDTKTTGITLANAGSGSAHNNLQPYFTVLKAIKY